jgi:hypothetical protein
MTLTEIIRTDTMAKQEAAAAEMARLRAGAHLSRRGLLVGLGALIAAPAIVRASSLMPVRNRLIAPPLDPALRAFRDLFRDYVKFPPTPAEVREWRQGLNEVLDLGIHFSWNAHGVNRFVAMVKAEERFMAQGLL